MPAPTLETERLRLRSFVDADREAFADMNVDPEVMRYMTKALTRAESDAFVDRMLERWETDGTGIWALERRADGRFLGFVALTVPNFQAPFTPCIEIGWRLARQAWGQGYATESARAALRWGFDVRGLDEIVSFTTVANERSRRVMERLGMTHDPADDFDHPDLPPDHPIRPHVLYRLPRARWAAVPSDAPVGG